MSEEIKIQTDAGELILGQRIGKGAFGSVFTSLSVQNGKTYAVKCIDTTKLSASASQNLHAEIELLQRLEHPHIVKYVASVQTGDTLNVVMEYVEGGSLLSLLKKFGNFPETLIIVYVAQVLEGLDYLHSQGIIHRDIKAANLLVTKDGAIKIADFGLAAAESAVDDAMGTPYWMAPEVIELTGSTTKADIWSVGCTVIELLTGSPPYFDLAPMSALYHIVKDDEVPIPATASAMCRDWLALALQRDPQIRPTAKKLLSHKWIKSALKGKTDNSERDKFIQRKSVIFPSKDASGLQKMLDDQEPKQRHHRVQCSFANDKNWDADFPPFDISKLKISCVSSSSTLRRSSKEVKTQSKESSSNAIKAAESVPTHRHFKSKKSSGSKDLSNEESTTGDSNETRRSHDSKSSKDSSASDKSTKMPPIMSTLRNDSSTRKRSESLKKSKTTPALIGLQSSPKPSATSKSEPSLPASHKTVFVPFTISGKTKKGIELKIVKRDIIKEWNMTFESRENEEDIFDAMENEESYALTESEKEMLYRKDEVNCISDDICSKIKLLQQDICVKESEGALVDTKYIELCNAITSQFAVLNVEEKESILKKTGIIVFVTMLRNAYSLQQEDALRGLDVLTAVLHLFNTFAENSEMIPMQMCTFGILSKTIGVANIIVEDINEEKRKNKEKANAINKKRIFLLDQIGSLVSEMIYQEQSSKMFISCSGLNFLTSILAGDFNNILPDYDSIFRKQTLLERAIGDLADVVNKYEVFSYSKNDLCSVLNKTNLVQHILNQLKKFSMPTCTAHPHIQELLQSSKQSKSSSSSKGLSNVNTCEFCEDLTSSLLGLLYFMTNGNFSSKQEFCDAKFLKSLFEQIPYLTPKARFGIFKFLHLLSDDPETQELLFDNGLVSMVLPFVTPKAEENKEIYHILSIILNVCSFSYQRCKCLLASNTIQQLMRFTKEHTAYQSIATKILFNIIRAKIPPKEKSLRSVLGTEMIDFFASLLVNGQQSAAALQCLALWTTTDVKVMTYITENKMDNFRVMLEQTGPRAMLAVANTLHEMASRAPHFSAQLGVVALHSLAGRIKRKACDPELMKVITELISQLFTDLVAEIIKVKACTPMIAIADVEKMTKIYKSLKKLREQKRVTSQICYQTNIKPILVNLKKAVEQDSE